MFWWCIVGTFVDMKVDLRDNGPDKPSKPSMVHHEVMVVAVIPITRRHHELGGVPRSLAVEQRDVCINGASRSWGSFLILFGNEVHLPINSI
jgi:hypothetical protein